jgi:predicted amidohydrolase
MRVAAIQMVSSHVVQDNLNQAEQLIGQAAREGAELVVLPEYFCLLGHKDTDKLQIQEQYSVAGYAEKADFFPIQHFLAAQAKSAGIWLAGGSLPLTLAPDAVDHNPGRQPGTSRVRNATLVYSPDGVCVARYDKMHLFSFDNGEERYDESRCLQAGTAPVAFDLPSRDGHTWRVGLGICYDLRFPELFRALGAELLLLPSSFTYTTGQAHWDVLMRARAIENQAYLLAPAQGGTHTNGRRTWGHSLAIDPWGAVLAEKAEGPGVVMADIDIAVLQAFRQQLPALTHRML